MAATRTRSRRSSPSAPLSAEVLWYLDSRGIPVPERAPLIRTPEPRDFPGAVFDADRVDRTLSALRHLRHTKGRWAGRPLELAPVQVAYLVAPVFGWVAPNEQGRLTRIIRDLWWETPRKSGKTTVVAAIAMILAFADGEPGAEVILGAAARDQTSAAFKPLAALVKASPMLQQAGVRALRGEILQDVTSSSLKAVSSRGDLQHGANVHGGLVDELHVHKDGALLEAIESGTGSRDQPLVCIITTADDGSTTSVYAQRREMVEKVARKVLKAPRMYGVIFAADATDDPFAESTWAKANPLYPETPSREFLEQAVDKARSGPVQMASFLRLHLGIRSKLNAAFFDLAKWDRNAGGLAELGGRRAFGGLDLAAVSDVTALVWLMPADDGGYDVACRFWVPEESLQALDARTSGSASGWVKDGWLTLTPGDVTDYGFVRAAINADAGLLEVAGIGVDPWNATQLTNDLIEDGLPVERVRQGPASLSAPLKELDRLVRVGTARAPMLRHGGNPVLRWMADNLRVRMDSNGNIAPDKKSSMEKIDGISAMTTAMFVAMNGEPPVVSAYDDGHGLIVI